MARPPKKRLFAKQDYAGAPKWFEAFLEDLNGFSTDVSDALENGLEIEKNLMAKVVEVHLRTGANVEDAFTDGAFVLTNKLPKRPRLVLVANIEDLTTGFRPPIVTAPGPTGWEYAADGNIRINFIAGLGAYSYYKITFLMVA